MDPAVLAQSLQIAATVVAAPALFRLVGIALKAIRTPKTEAREFTVTMSIDHTRPKIVHAAETVPKPIVMRLAPAQSQQLFDALEKSDESEKVEYTVRVEPSSSA